MTLEAARDNTLIESPTGSLSNGAGDHFFSGRTGQAQNSIRRGVIEFDIAGVIPAGATIHSAALRLNVSQTQPGTQAVALHRLLGDWGEGGSNAPGNEGSGTAAAPGDATWLHKSFQDSLWDRAGGDFVAVASASTLVGNDGAYMWSSSELAADVQAWLDQPNSNFGWLIKGNESAGSTSKRFDSRTNPAAAVRPSLLVDFSLPVLLGDMNGDDGVNNLDVFPYSLALTDPAAFESAFPNIEADQVGDINQDGAFNNLDTAPFVQLLTGGAASVPEPAGWALMLVGAAASAFCGLRRRQRS